MGDRGSLAALSFQPNCERVLVILLDTFQADIFADVVSKDEELESAFDGFVFYRDAAAVARTTALTIPAFYTGLEYDPEWSIRDYFRQARKRRSFVQAWADAGLDVALANSYGFCPEGAFCESFARLARHPRIEFFRELTMLLDLSLLRVTPLPWKAWVYNDGRWRLSQILAMNPVADRAAQSRELLEDIAQHAHVKPGPPAAKLIHVPIPHPPLVTREDCSFASRWLPYERPYMLNQSRCAAKTAATLLRRLRELGVLEQSTIIVFSDHGAGFPSSWVETGDAEWQQIVGAANPLLLVKPPYSTGPLRISRREVRITDVGATACDAIVGCSFNRDESIFRVQDHSEPRMYNHYDWNHDLWDSDRPVEVSRWRISGPLHARSSWEEVVR